MKECKEQKTIENMFPGSYEFFCELTSLIKEIGIDRIIDGFKKEGFHNITHLKEIFEGCLSSTHRNGIELNLKVFYPNKTEDEIKEDCSRVILNNEIRNTEFILQKLKKLSADLGEIRRNNILIQNQREFGHFCLKGRTLISLLLRAFKLEVRD